MYTGGLISLQEDLIGDMVRFLGRKTGKGQAEGLSPAIMVSLQESPFCVQLHTVSKQENVTLWLGKVLLRKENTEQMHDKKP